MKTFLVIFVMSLGVASAAPLPLGGAANVPLVDDVAGDDLGGWTDQGAENSLNGFPAGEVTIQGIPFVIPPEGQNAAVGFQNSLRPNLPKHASIPAGGATGGLLYLLTTCAFDFSRGEEVATVTIRYADGTSQVEPLVYERQTGGWWTPSAPDEGIVAWRGMNSLGVPIGAYLSWIKLAGTPVESIDIRVAGGKGMFFLIGLSISDVTGIKIPPRWLPEPLATDTWRPTEPIRDNGRPSVWETATSPDDRRLIVELDLPLREFAPTEAAKLARTVRLLGYNAVKLPSLETFLPANGNAVTSGADPEALDSLRAILDALKGEHLAISLTLGGGRQYGIDDGVAAYRQINNMLANQCLVDPEATRLLLDSVSAAPDIRPFSVSLLSSTVLLGDYETLFTSPHRNMLQNAWRTWLQGRYPSNDALAAAWQVPGCLPPLGPRESLARSGVELLNVHNFSAFQARFRKRFADQMQFLEDLQTGWFSMVVPQVRRAFPSARIFSPGMMVTDKLGDFQTHPAEALDGIEERLGDTFLGIGTEGAAYFFNRSPFLPPDRWSYRPAFNRISGKPFVIDENASAWPGDYEFARLLLTMVFGGLQGWDGIVHRGISTLAPSAPMVRPDKAGNSLQNPAFLAVLPLGRNLFARGDIARLPLAFSRVLESPATFREHGPASLPPILQNLLFTGGVQASFTGTGEWPAAGAATLLKSPSGQVECDQANDLLKISCPASMALAGKNGGSLATDSVLLESSTGYGIVYATSLDGAPLASARSILVGAVGRTRNSGQTVDISNGPLGLHERLWRIRENGTPPILMEPAKGVLTLKGASADGTWTLQALNLLGQPTDAKPVSISPKAGTLRVEFDNKTSPLFLLNHEGQ